MASKRSHQGSQPEDPKRKVLVQYFKLQSSLNLANQPSHNIQQANVLTHNASTAIADIDGIGEYLSSHVEAIYYNERRLPDSTKATEVFQLPELLEMILEHTDFIDILHMSETCHGIRDIIYASRKLQVGLFLKPVDQSDEQQMDFQSPLIRYGKKRRYYYGGYSVEFDMGGDEDSIDSDSEEDSVDEFSLHIRFEKVGSGHGLPRIGKSWTNMILCQPSIKTVEITAQCDCGASDGTDSDVVRLTKGFTLGALLGQAKKAFVRGCLWCKLAGTEDQVFDGWEYAISSREAYSKIKAPVDSVLIEAHLH